MNVAEKVTACWRHEGQAAIFPPSDTHLYELACRNLGFYKGIVHLGSQALAGVSLSTLH